jgi:hypothetical protein
MDWTRAVQDAVAETDAALASKISGLCRLKDAEIMAIAPTKIDKENLAKIIGIVKDEAMSNEQKAAALQSINNSLAIIVGIAAKVV